MSIKDNIEKNNPEPQLNEDGKDQRYNNNPKGSGMKKGDRAYQVERYGRRKLKGTPKQIIAQKLFLDMVKGKPDAPNTWTEIMERAGYSSKTKPFHMLRSEPFQHLMQVMPDTEIALKWFQWAMDDDPAMRGHSLRAGENIMKLKNRFPDKKVQFEKVENKISDLFVNAEEGEVDEEKED